MLTHNDIVKLIISKMRHWLYEDRRNEIHLTDLTSPCLRKIWFEKKQPLPDDIDDAIRLWWGKCAHLMPLTDNHELKLEFEGVKTSIDEYDSLEKIVIEKKTATFIPKDVAELQRYYSHYIEQINLESLFLIENGYDVRQAFIVFYKFGEGEKGRPIIQAFEIPFNYEETKQLFEERRAKLLTVLAGEEPPEIPENFSPYDYPCSYCKYRARCF